jgi:hypothetical protein
MFVNKTSDTVFLNDLNNLQNIVICYAITFFLITGTISNFLNIIISSRKKMLKSTVGIYYIFMSLFNIFTLISGWLILYPPAADIFPNIILISGESIFLLFLKPSNLILVIIKIIKITHACFYHIYIERQFASLIG